MTDRFVVVRSHPATDKSDGWDVLSSVMLTDVDIAHDFAAHLDHARVYRLVEVPTPTDHVVDTGVRGLAVLADRIDRADEARFTFADVTSVSELIGQFGGAVSMCWEPRPTGVFDSTTAGRFVDGALARLKELTGE